MDSRPKLNKKISLIDFLEFYWLKNELTNFCKKEGLKVTGSKIEIANRISNYLKTGGTKTREFNPKTKSISKFDWRNEKLSSETIITDNYKSTENVREYFEKEIGKGFKFNVEFMNWMKANTGKTLGESIKEWNRIKFKNKSNANPKEIAPQFEYNRYLRDFLADNPELTRSIGIELWKKKKAVRGTNRYEKEDLKFLKGK